MTSPMPDDSADHSGTSADSPAFERGVVRRLGHDLNNVMTSVQGYAEILLEEMGESSAHRGDLERLHEAARRASALVRELMAVSR